MLLIAAVYELGQEDINRFYYWWLDRCFRLLCCCGGGTSLSSLVYLSSVVGLYKFFRQVVKPAGGLRDQAGFSFKKFWLACGSHTNFSWSRCGGVLHGAAQVGNENVYDSPRQRC